MSMSSFTKVTTAIRVGVVVFAGAADVYAEHTGLSMRLSRVLALELAGYDHEQISDSEGRSVTTIRKWAKRIRDETEDEDALAGLLQFL